MRRGWRPVPFYLEVDKARSYALDFAEQRFDCPNKCLRVKGQRCALTPPLPFESVILQFEDRKCAQKFDDILRAYDPERVSKLLKR